MERNVSTFKIHPWHDAPEEVAILRLYDWMKVAGLVHLLNAYSVGDAAESGYLMVLEWLHSHAPNGWTTNAMDAAASHGQLQVLEWLYKNRKEGCTVEAMNQAAARGHLEVVKWLYDHHAERCDVRSALTHAANYGQLDVLVWLMDHHDASRAICTKCLIRATLSSSRRVVGLPPSPYVIEWLATDLTPLCRTCARHDVVKDPTLAVIGRALDRDDLDVAKYFYRRLDANTTLKIKRYTLKSVAASGHLPMLKWLVEHGKKRDSSSGDDDDWDGEWQDTLMTAIRCGQDHAVDWINSYDEGRLPISTMQFRSTHQSNE